MDADRHDTDRRHWSAVVGPTNDRTHVTSDPAPDTNSRMGISFFLGGTNEINLIAMHNIINYELNGQKTRKNWRTTPLTQYNREVVNQRVLKCLTSANH